MADFYENQEQEEKVLLIGVSTQDEDMEASLDELGELADTAGAVVLGRVIQNREAAHPGTYIGKGKIEEVRLLAEELGADGVICDDELSPAQLRGLEKELEMKVMDRTLVILDIFAKHATTREGKLQVEMAQLEYRLARLSGLGKSLSSLGGGIGTRGPGEKKLETDRRLIKSRLARLNRELKQMQLHLLQFPVQPCQTAFDQSPVCLQFFLSRSSRSNAASQTGKGFSQAGQAGKPVLQLGHFHLKLSFSCSGMLRENVQNHQRAVHDLHLQLFLQAAELGRRKLVVADHAVCPQLFCQKAHFFYLSFSNIGTGVSRFPVLNDSSQDHRSRRVSQLSQLVQGGFHILILRAYADQKDLFLLFLIFIEICQDRSPFLSLE